MVPRDWLLDRSEMIPPLFLTELEEDEEKDLKKWDGWMDGWMGGWVGQ